MSKGKWKVTPGKWSSWYDQCVICGRTDRPHQSLGMCRVCYYTNKCKDSYKCIVCGIEFTPPYYLGKNKSTRRFCSKSCATKYQTAKYYDRDKLISDIKTVIVRYRRYITVAEICGILHISAKTLTKYRISMISMNDIVGMKKPVNVLEGICYSYLKVLFNDIQRQKTFDDCISPKGYKLRFDFYTESQNLLIEFDGAQHTNKNHKYYSLDGVERDRIKDEWSMDNGYKLVRIPYIRRITLDYIVSQLTKYNIDVSVIH